MKSDSLANIYSLLEKMNVLNHELEADRIVKNNVLWDPTI